MNQLRQILAIFQAMNKMEADWQYTIDKRFSDDCSFSAFKQNSSVPTNCERRRKYDCCLPSWHCF